MTAKTVQNISDQALLLVTLILAAMLPFLLIDPVIVIGPIDLSNIEIITLLSAGLWLINLVSVAVQGQLRSWLLSYKKLTLILVALFVFLVIAEISALLAPEYKVSALRFTFRLLIGAYLFLLTIYVANTHHKIRLMMWALVIGAGMSALLGIGEALPWSDIDRLLLAFKTAPSMVGGILRVSATFQYTTIASMYFEMAVPIAVILAASSNGIRRYLALAITAICTVAVVLTLTRSGMAGLFILNIGLIVTALWRYRPLLLPAFVAIAVLLLSIGLMLIDGGNFSTRLTTEGDTDWYNAVYEPPEAQIIPVGQKTPLSISITNTGKVRWHATGDNAYYLGYYWYNEDLQAFVDQAHVEIPLPYNIAPGENVDITIEVEPFLKAGNYRIIWGMLQSNVLWFRHKGVQEASTLVEIIPNTAVQTPDNSPGISNIPPGGTITDGDTVSISRSDLWRIAFQMWREHPILGVGPDNYRLLYGSYLGLSSWYEANHSNNLYLELLATMGLLGFGIYLGYIGILALYLQQMVRQQPRNLTPIGLAGVLLMFLMHGAFDYFLPWLPTLGFFWMTAGLISALYLHTDASSAEHSSTDHTETAPEEVPVG